MASFCIFTSLKADDFNLCLMLSTNTTSSSLVSILEKIYMIFTKRGHFKQKCIFYSL